MLALYLENGIAFAKQSLGGGGVYSHIFLGGQIVSDLFRSLKKSCLQNISLDL